MDYQRLPKLLTNSEVSVSSSQSRPVQECESRVRILNILRVIQIILIGKLDLRIVVSAPNRLSHTTRNLCLFVMMLDLNCFVGREL